MTLEAELAARSGFKGLTGPTPVEAVIYLKLHHDPKGWAKDKPLDFDGDIRYASPYDHLARVKEWSAAPGGGEEGGEP